MMLIVLLSTTASFGFWSIEFNFPPLEELTSCRVTKVRNGQ